jgi:hypothetical protein
MTPFGAARDGAQKVKARAHSGGSARSSGPGPSLSVALSIGSSSMALCTRSVTAPGAGWSGTRPRITGPGCGSLLALRRPVQAVADRASSVAPIGVQLVKYVLHLRYGTGRPGRGAGWPHRNRRGSGAGRRPWPWPPGRSPERDRGQRGQKDHGQRDVRRHHVLHHALPQVWAAAAAVLPRRLGRPARHLRRHGRRRRAASAGQMTCHRPRAPRGVRAPAPGPGVPARGRRRPPTEPGWPGTGRPAGRGPAPWPGPHLGPAGRPAGPPSSRAPAGSSACRRGCASSPGQPPSREGGHRRSRPSWQAPPRRRRRRGEQLAGYRASPAHPVQRSLRVVAELPGHPLDAPRAAVGTHGRGDGLADLTRAGLSERCRTDANKAPAQTALVPG